MLLRAGFEPAQVALTLDQLPDPIDSDRDGTALIRLGVTLGQLTDRAGGSP